MTTSSEPLTGRRAIVTGASRGIGRAIAAAFTGAGATVGLLGRDRDALARVADEIGAPAWASADVGRREEIVPALARVRERLGGVDVLVCNAGGVEAVSAGDDLEPAAAAWDRVIAANLTGAFLCAMAVVPHLPRPGGRIVTVSSIAAYTGGSSGGTLAYGAAKAGVLGLTRSLAAELAAEGIAVNAVVPGFIAGTDFFGPGDQSERTARLVASIPAARAGTPADVAGAATFLASDAADYVRGQVLHVNGGWYQGG